MSGETPIHCPGCGEPGRGNFCARCGAPLREDGPRRACPSCGRAVGADALYCGECGTPLRARPRKSAAAYAPWILAGLLLVGFSVAVALFVQGQSRPRTGDAPMTGGVPGREDDAGAEAAGGTASGSSMPTAAELAAMTPVEAADRLFDRTMRLEAAGDTARARFFADMGLQAYERVPPAERDADIRLHRGLLQLTLGRSEAAESEAEAILEGTAEHPYGLFLQIRIAEERGNRQAADTYRDRLRDALQDGAVPEAAYAPHAAALRAVAGLSDGTGSGGR